MYDYCTNQLILFCIQDNSEEDDDNDQTLEGEITYDDPKSRYERQKIIAQLDDCSPNVNKEPNLKSIADKQVYDTRFSRFFALQFRGRTECYAFR